MNVDNQKTGNQIAVFQLENQSYGINIQDISEIIHMQDITGLPNSPSHIEGVVNLRDKLCTILNGRVLLGLPQRTSEVQEKIIVLQIAPVGIIVDEVSEIIEIEDSALKALDGIDSLDSLGFIDCLVEVNNKIITVLNIKKMVLKEERKEGEEEPEREQVS